MTTIHELLRAILHLIRDGCNADAVSLFISIPAAGSHHPLLVHDGEIPAVPELVDVETAKRFVLSMSNESANQDIVESRKPGGRLTSVPSLLSLLGDEDLQSVREERRHGSSLDCPRVMVDDFKSAWLGILGGEPLKLTSLLDLVRNGERASLQLAAGSLIACRTQIVCTTEMDPVSQLPARSAYPIGFRRMAADTSVDRPPGLILVNPDDFDVVNDQFNRGAGDNVIREIAKRLSSSVRHTDFPFRYGAAMFGVLLPDVTSEVIRKVAAKIQTQLSEAPYREGSVRLSFKLGAALADNRECDNDNSGAMELARRADAALNLAKRSSGSRFELWDEEIGTQEANRLDSLSGIFTADPTQDYRNMRLLWNTVRMIATSTDVNQMKDSLLNELVAVFRISAAGVYDEGPSGGSWKILRRSQNEHDEKWHTDTEEDTALARIRRQVMNNGKTVTEAVEGMELFRCMIPLPTGDRTLGCMYLEGNTRLFTLNSSDLVFFEALAEQIAMALDRSRLAAMELQQHEQIRLKLQQELTQLQKSIKRSSLVYRSDSMDRLLRTAQKLASTDTTVLINGESGTGKEVLARTIHQLSRRSEKPLVVVDCSAITTSLIDSELFGHERGAFTGADRKSDGRLSEADGGTVLLDEIGELPLEVQSKLLRFVQEKQFTPVGGNRSRTVDVRVIALTNRDLAVEAAAGRFREDLYHRLNVMRLLVPPLRNRTEDIEYLAKHFIKTFATQYGRVVTGFSPEGLEALIKHPWHGNVRELQNRVMRAVVLTESEWIGPMELELLDQPAFGASIEKPTEWPTVPEKKMVSLDRAWEDLRQTLSQEIDRIAASETPHPPPLQKWVHHDLILEASRKTGDVTTRAANLLGIPETTFRRKKRTVSADVAAGSFNRPADWEPIRRQITSVLEAGNPDHEDLLELARSSILEELATKIPGDSRAGAAFMGVTETTFKKWSNDLAKLKGENNV